MYARVMNIFQSWHERVIMVITNFTKLEITERSKIKFIDPFSSRNILQGEKFERENNSFIWRRDIFE